MKVESVLRDRSEFRPVSKQSFDPIKDRRKVGMPKLDFLRRDKDEKVPKYLRDDHPKGKWLITFDERTALKKSDAMLEDLAKGRVERRPRRMAKRKRKRTSKYTKARNGDQTKNLKHATLPQNEIIRKLDSALRRHNALLQARMAKRIGDNPRREYKEERIHNERENTKGVKEDHTTAITIAAVISECERLSAARPSTTQPRVRRPKSRSRVVSRPGTANPSVREGTGRQRLGLKRQRKVARRPKSIETGNSRPVTAPGPIGGARFAGRRSSASRMTWLKTRQSQAKRPSTVQESRARGEAFRSPGQYSKVTSACAPEVSSSHQRKQERIRRRIELVDKDDEENTYLKSHAGLSMSSLAAIKRIQHKLSFLKEHPHELYELQKAVSSTKQERSLQTLTADGRNVIVENAQAVFDQTPSVIEQGMASAWTKRNERLVRAKERKSMLDEERMNYLRDLVKFRENRKELRRQKKEQQLRAHRWVGLCVAMGWADASGLSGLISRADSTLL